METSEFHIDKLGRYFRMCLESLPQPYVGLDTSRLSAVYFAILGLDIIDQLDTIDRARVINYIYALQLSFAPSCCFKGRSGFLGSTYLGQNFQCGCDIKNVCGSCAGSESGGVCECMNIGGLFKYMEGHIAMTYTAVLTLVALGDDLSRLNKEAVITGIGSLQQPNGSFRSLSSPGECDTRFLYCACAVSHILDDWRGVDKKLAVRYVRSCMSYEGGIALVPGSEAHGGSTYCALAALSLMGALPCSDNDEIIVDGTEECLSTIECETILRWCIKRQNEGYCGRTNKDNDSCYSFWVGASIAILKRFDLTHTSSTRSFLLGRCQHPYIGGFAKVPDSHPDVLHTFYSLAWLAIAGEKETFPIEPTLGLRRSRVQQYLNKRNVGGGLEVEPSGSSSSCNESDDTAPGGR